MNVHQLEAFGAIMEAGSFTRAAQKLRISQPAVSKMIALLEHDCGFTLFTRHKNSVVPTQEAHMMYAEVERMLVGVKSIAERAASIRSLKFGCLNLVAFPSLSMRLLPSIISRFLAGREGVKVTLENRGSRFLLDRVASQNVDLGLGLLMTDYPGVRFERLLSMEAVCILPPLHKLVRKTVVTVADLAGEPFISMGPENSTRFLVDQVFEREKVTRNVVIEAQLSQACCAFVSKRLGVAIVNPLSVAGFDPSMLVVRPFRPAITIDVWLVLPQYREPSLLAQAFIRHVRQALVTSLSKKADETLFK